MVIIRIYFIATIVKSDRMCGIHVAERSPQLHPLDAQGYDRETPSHRGIAGSVRGEDTPSRFGTIGEIWPGVA